MKPEKLIYNYVAKSNNHLARTCADGKSSKTGSHKQGKSFNLLKGTFQGSRKTLLYKVNKSKITESPKAP